MRGKAIESPAEHAGNHRVSVHKVGSTGAAPPSEVVRCCALQCAADANQ